MNKQQAAQLTEGTLVTFGRYGYEGIVTGTLAPRKVRTTRGWTAYEDTKQAVAVEMIDRRGKGWRRTGRVENIEPRNIKTVIATAEQIGRLDPLTFAKRLTALREAKAVAARNRRENAKRNATTADQALRDRLVQHGLWLQTSALPYRDEQPEGTVYARGTSYNDARPADEVTIPVEWLTAMLDRVEAAEAK